MSTPLFTTQDLQNANPDQGFAFPGTFELSAMGPAEAGLEAALPDLLEAAGIAVLREQVVLRASSAGRYVSVRIAFRAESREQYEAAHVALRSHPEVKWTV
jgi:putative lipoic acid-binding regulatory protein